MCLYSKSSLKRTFLILLLFFGILISSCNDCDNGGQPSEENLIYFSASELGATEFSGFVFNSENLFVKEILDNGQIAGFADNRVLFLRENGGANSMFLLNENSAVEEQIFEEIAGIEIINPASNTDNAVVNFFGDDKTLYQTDINGNLKVISRDAKSNYKMDVNSEGFCAFIENPFGRNQISIFDTNGDIIQSSDLESDATNDENRISWDEDGTNVIYSLKSSEGSTVFRTRIDGFTESLFEETGQRVTKPFFAKANLIGYYHLDRSQVEFRDLSDSSIVIVYTSSGTISDLKWYHNSDRLIIEQKALESQLNDIIYLDFNFDGNNIQFEENLLINNAYRAYSK